jgi:hypothetical protein
MNLDEAVELLKVFSAIPVKDAARKTKIRVFYREGEGYALGIKVPLVSAQYGRYLDEVVKSRRRQITESRGYLMVYGYR